MNVFAFIPALLPPVTMAQRVPAEFALSVVFRFYSESGYSRSSTLYSRGDDKLLPKVGKLQRAGTPKKLDRLGVLRSQVERETAPIVR